ncbi:type II secretion system protein N [Yunchengibacter salinarum]|uniref:type II secretion system protein N n=1 Tax=Yunchengibacter salinarum TaxID=3133399 RepID=UPI0035B60995
MERLARPFLLVALTLALAYVTARAFWAVTGLANPMAERLPTGQPTASADRLPDTSAALLTGFDPFHRRTAGSDGDGADTAAAKAAPETSLDLKLYGVRTGGPNRPGSAIIRLPDHEQRAFTVGSTLLPGVRLVAIRPTYVTISRGGTRESLFLNGLSAEDVRARARRQGQAPPEAAISEPGEKGQPRHTLSRGTLSRLMGSVTMTPTASDAPAQGFRLAPKAATDGADTASAPFRALGLRAGDILTAANGAAIRSREDLSALPGKARDSGGLTLTLYREGSPVTLRFDYQDQP